MSTFASKNLGRDAARENSAGGNSDLAMLGLGRGTTSELGVGDRRIAEERERLEFFLFLEQLQDLFRFFSAGEKR